MTGAMARSALISVVYRKSLVLSNIVPSLFIAQMANRRPVWSLQMAKS